MLRQSTVSMGKGGGTEFMDSSKQFVDRRVVCLVNWIGYIHIVVDNFMLPVQQEESG